MHWRCHQCGALTGQWPAGIGAPPGGPASLNANAVAAATAIAANFGRQVKAIGSLGEVELFRALRRSIVVGARSVQVREYHGNAKQVRHDTDPCLGLGTKQCELSDLMIVAYSDEPNITPRLTFVQAKYERGSRHPAKPLDANYIQWSLLSTRPEVTGARRFRPPRDLLSSASHPSIASFAFFVHDAAARGGAINLVYASADLLVPSTSPFLKTKGRLENLFWYAPSGLTYYAPCLCKSSGTMELVEAHSLEAFLTGLLSIEIGQPISPTWPGYSWLVNELTTIAATETGAALRDLRWLIEEASRGRPPPPPSTDNDGLGDGPPRRVPGLPCRTLLLIRSNTRDQRP
jgi:hypothetical protein